MSTQAQYQNGDGSRSAATYDNTYSTYPHAFAQVTVASTAQSLAALGVAVPPWAALAFLLPLTGTVYYRCDGTAPTTSAGMPVQQNQAWPVQGRSSLLDLELIAASNTTLVVEFRG